jgi:hypothetical protein
MLKSRVWNDGAPEGIVVLNYAKSGAPAVRLPSQEEIPTLVPNEIMAELMRGDSDPCYSVEAIAFPAVGNGLRYGSRGIYERKFFDSVANVLKKRAIPGSKFGHEWSGKCSDDFFLVGMSVVANADDPKSGWVYFKHYIPLVGYTTPNDGLRRNARIHNIRYSIVAKPEYTVKTGTDGVEEYRITGTLGSERNDAVDEGAMNQVVNSASSLDIDAARALIENGAFDKDTNVEGDPVQNGVVYRSALRRLASRANEEDRAALGELISAIDNKSKNGRKPTVDKDEALKLLSNLIKNGSENKQDIAKALGIETRSESDVANAATVETMKNKLGDKPFEKLEAILTENAASSELKVESAVREIAGDKMLKNAAAQDVVNPAHAYAAKACKGLSGEALKNAVEELKKDQVLITLNAQRADGNSALYRVEAGGAKPTVAKNSGDDIPTIHVGAKE